MKSLFVLIFSAPFFLGGLQVHCQSNLDKFYQEYLKAKKNDISPANNIAGSQYDDSTFVNALVFMKNADAPMEGKIRYNNFADEMEFLKEDIGQVLTLSNKSNLDSIVLANATYQYLVAAIEGRLQLGYYEKLFSKECGLYFQSSRSFHDAQLAKSSYDQNMPARFEEDDDAFFARFNNGPLLEIPRRGKKIDKLFRENGFVNKNKSKPKYEREELIVYVRGMEGL